MRNLKEGVKSIIRGVATDSGGEGKRGRRERASGREQLGSPSCVQEYDGAVSGKSVLAAERDETGG
jgi:hypothetical protein